MLTLRVNFKNDTEKIGKAYASHFLFLTMQEIERTAKSKVPVFEGHLRRSILTEPLEAGHFRYFVYSDKAYARAMEYGTQAPHPLPPEAYEDLQRWARIKLGDGGLAFPIAKKIEEEGLNAQPFFRPALNEVKTNKLRLIRQRTDRAFNR